MIMPSLRGTKQSRVRGTARLDCFVPRKDVISRSVESLLLCIWIIFVLYTIVTLRALSIYFLLRFLRSCSRLAPRNRRLPCISLCQARFLIYLFYIWGIKTGELLNKSFGKACTQVETSWKCCYFIAFAIKPITKRACVCTFWSNLQIIPHAGIHFF